MRALVFQIGSVGDTVVSIPAFRALRRYWGDDVFVSVLQQDLPGTRPLPFQMLSAAGVCEDYVTYQPARGKGIIKAVLDARKTIKAGRYESIGYVAPAQRSEKQVRRDSLFFRLAGVKNQIGFHAIPEHLFTDASKTTPHEAVLRMDRLQQDGVEIRESDLAVPLLGETEETRAKATSWLKAQGRQDGKPLWAVCLGTVQPSKEWPQERFQAVIAKTLATYDLDLVIVGGPGERQIAGQAIAAAGRGFNACGEFTIPESISVLAQAQAYLGLDTGTTHLASGIGVPCVAIYSDHNHRGQWDPLGTGHTLIRHYVECGACHLRECPVAGHPCMSTISVEEVAEAVAAQWGTILS